MAKYLTYIGTYGAGGVHGLPTVEADTETGALRILEMNREIEECTFLTFNREKSRIYAIAGLKGLPKPNGGLAVFAVDGPGLRLLDAVPVGARPPCYVRVSDDGRAVYCAHYREGTGMMFPLNPDGTFVRPGIGFAHSGSGPVADRQEKAHVHCTELSPDGRLLYVVDLGIDTVKAYRSLPEKGRMVPVPEADLHARPGEGPRHIVFSRDGARAYVIHELASTVSVWNLENPLAPELVQTVPLLPESYVGPRTASAIHFSSDGSRLYCSNRGHDSIVAFNVNQQTGLLEHMATSSTFGRWPRDFAVLPGDGMILVAHQYTDTLVCLRVDRKTGAMAPAGDYLTIPLAPVRVLVGARLE